MRIHSQLMHPQTGPYDPSSVRAEQAERAARTRRKLQRAAQTIENADVEPVVADANLLMGQWLNVNHNQSLADDNYTPGPARCEPFPG